MWVYLRRRLLLTIPTLLGVSALTFSMIHLAPGDPVAIMLGGEFAASGRDMGRLRAELGLDQPVPVQFARYLARAARGDLGASIRSRRPVAAEIRDRFPPTFELTVAAMAVAVSAGVLTGTIAATARSPAVDSATMGVALLGLSMPTFWSGLLLILLFSLKLGWLPITATGLRALILPAVTLAMPAGAVLARMTRSSLLEVLDQDYVRTARATGVAERLVIFRHALKNAFIPILTIIALQFGGLLAGAVIVESVFARPGLGRLAVNAILSRDFPLMQGIVLFTAVIYVFVNLIVDCSYAVLDPRIRYQ
ncbi:MAG: ABC transporter permease [Armatimonadetes bacterium]|nr:ABC transporter permease [Armatimonadota bacterium]